MEREYDVEVNDVVLHVRELGVARSDIPLVVVHGGPDWDHSYLLPGVTRVARHRHVVLYDLRGCGNSSRGLDSEAYQPEHVVADLAGMLDALGLARVDLLGFSTGGQIVQSFLEHHAAVVRRIVLASTTAYGDVDGLLADHPDFERRRRLPVPWPDWAGFEPGSGNSDLHATVEWAITGAPTAIWDLARLDDYLDLLSRVRFSGDWIAELRAGRLKPWRPSDPTELIRGLGPGVLILHGRHDMTFPIEVAHRLHREAPESSLVVLEAAGHMAHVDQPGAWATAVNDFLS